MEQSRDPAVPAYRERLWPSPGVCLLVPLAGAAAAVLLLPVGVSVAVVAGVSVLAALLVWIAVGTPVVAVHDGELVAGRAHVPVTVLGTLTVFRGRDAVAERGPRLDPRAFLLIRGWLDPVLRVELRDPHDPTPYWLLSTRHPDELARAVDAARAGSEPR